jgi:uroporphyrinogen decarboxylase
VTLMLTSRERLLTAIHNETPDRLPCQVHSWMSYYLQTYLGGRDQFQAYAHFPGMDWVIYESPRFIYADQDLANWQIARVDLGQDRDGSISWQERIETPKGTLTHSFTRNEITSWTTEYLIKSERDFEIWEVYVPVPERVDWSPIVQAKERIGEKGIVRGGFFGFGQGSPWQDFCTLYGTQNAIMATFDQPQWVHHCLDALLEKKLRVIQRAGRFELDLVETGGGAGSSTVISPKLHREFCLPYDRQQHEALHNAGTHIVYHLCGGVMPLLETVAQNGADGLETMTPPAMGGDCDLAEAKRRVGDRLFFIGGFDQNQGFEHGSPEIAAMLVRQCHQACPNGGYICSPSDHFFHGDPANIQAFVDQANRCTYQR